jgi:protein-S-isoprenylcysteine O-methyltransferase Ste14
MYLLKQISSFILPVTVLVIVPIYIEDKWMIAQSFHFYAGLLLMMIGLLMMVLTITSFIRIGKGTLAPWAPTKQFVVKGLYRYVRNPMITGVLLVLLGEAFAFWSLNITKWVIVFFVINTIYFIIYEEPNLEERFGEPYKDYKKHVSRWIPNIKPYKPESKKE